MNKLRLTCVRTLIMVLVSVALLATAFVSTHGPARANSSNPYLYPYNQAGGVTYNVNDVTQTWNSWKSTVITANNAGGGGRMRVMGGVDNQSTVSEGQGYGILFASIFDDQTTLDGLWLFTKDHLNSQGLMDWHIGNPGQTLGQGAATDGDEDMALGMINACVKVNKGAWPASPKGLNYCTIATNLINAIYTYEVDKPGNQPAAGLPNNQGNELLPGDEWNLAQDYPEGIVNLSYFSPGYFTVFGKFTGKTNEWNAVNARNYAITNLAQGKPGNCSKLVPNWNQYDGDPQLVSWQPQNYNWWSWDAARFGWRIAVDKAWYNSANARETMNEVGGFFSSVGIVNVKAQYRLDGTSVDSYQSAFFVANAAAAIWAAPNPAAVSCGAATGSLKSTPQQAYNQLLSINDTSYYSGAWRLLTMLLMTGNFPNFYEMSLGGGAPTNTPVAPTNTPSAPTSTPSAPTNTPTTGGSCQVTYTIANQWNTGFTADVTIKNTGSSAVNGWTLTWTFPNNQQITNAWNATPTQNGQNVSAKDAGWNSTISSGATASFGFQANWSGANAKPTNFKLNGVSCTAL